MDARAAARGVMLAPQPDTTNSPPTNPLGNPCHALPTASTFCLPFFAAPIIILAMNAPAFAADTRHLRPSRASSKSAPTPLEPGKLPDPAQALPRSRDQTLRKARHDGHRLLGAHRRAALQRHDHLHPRPRQPRRRQEKLGRLQSRSRMAKGQQSRGSKRQDLPQNRIRLRRARPTSPRSPDPLPRRQPPPPNNASSKSAPTPPSPASSPTCSSASATTRRSSSKSTA